MERRHRRPSAVSRDLCLLIGCYREKDVPIDCMCVCRSPGSPLSSYTTHRTAGAVPGPELPTHHHHHHHSAFYNGGTPSPPPHRDHPKLSSQSMDPIWIPCTLITPLHPPHTPLYTHVLYIIYPSLYNRHHCLCMGRQENNLKTPL